MKTHIVLTRFSPVSIAAPAGDLRGLRDWLLEKGCPACCAPARAKHYNANIIECRCGAEFHFAEGALVVQRRCSRHPWSDVTERVASLALQHIHRQRQTRKETTS